MAHKDPEARKKYQREYRRRWTVANPDKQREYRRRFREKNPDYATNWRRARELPQPTRPEPQWCECCGRFFEKTPHLDHDHITGSFRGWLCGPCNHALGLLGDGVEGVEKALAYLKRGA